MLDVVRQVSSSARKQEIPPEELRELAVAMGKNLDILSVRYNIDKIKLFILLQDLLEAGYLVRNVAKALEEMVTRLEKLEEPHEETT